MTSDKLRNGESIGCKRNTLKGTEMITKTNMFPR